MTSEQLTAVALLQNMSSEERSEVFDSFKVPVPITLTSVMCRVLRVRDDKTLSWHEKYEKIFNSSIISDAESLGINPFYDPSSCEDCINELVSRLFKAKPIKV